MVNERLLQYIWQFQHFNHGEMRTRQGEEVEVLYAGQLNSNQGPDFTNAKIRIGNATWVGTVELHILTSDWNRHKHDSDGNFKNVILHVVWQDDGEQPGEREFTVPVLELKDRVQKILLHRFEELMNSASFIACQNSISGIDDLTWQSWKERLLAERLIRKARMIEHYLEQNNFHWEESFWWLLARNFGLKVNADAFEAIARSIPLGILARTRHQIHQLEALLFGQGGQLEGDFNEDYPRLLQKEYRFLKVKYHLRPSAIPLHFLRMRPVNFPTVRLAQLAMLVHESRHLLATIKEVQSAKELGQWLSVTANDYWHYHYRFDEPAGFRKKTVGNDMIDNLIINTVSPVLFAFGNYHNDQKLKEKALAWLSGMPPEKNSVIASFCQIGLDAGSAFDSQAMIELKTQYCDEKKCLACAVGNAILKPAGIADNNFQ